MLTVLGYLSFTNYFDEEVIIQQSKILQLYCYHNGYRTLSHFIRTYTENLLLIIVLHDIVIF